ncbi:MAG: hypothetical protein FWH29_10580 [Methanobrevibacter sp.]|nr:hypothetical protein [Methanobrevibacter sp.]
MTKIKDKIIIFDANLLLVFILGLNNQSREINHPRSNKYKLKHSKALKELFDYWSPLIIIGPVLIETFHLLKNPASKKQKIPPDNLISLYRIFLDNHAFKEERVEIEKVINDNRINKLGLTDTSIIHLVKNLIKRDSYEIAVVSDDKELIKEINELNIETYFFDAKGSLCSSKN